MTAIRIDVGGPGEPAEILTTIRGCPCRTEDFTMALVKFANEWRQAADARGSGRPLTEGKPCGCKDAK